MADNGAPLILLTRPAAQSRRFAEVIGARAEVRIAPLQEIVPSAPVPAPVGIKGLIFTSETAVHLFAAAHEAPGMPAYCVGPRTAEAATGAGLAAQVVGGNAEAMVAALTAAPPPSPLLHLHGHHTRGQVAARLTEAGIATTGVEIYRQEALPAPAGLADLAQGRPVLVPLFSPRSATLWSDAVSPARGQWLPLCLSEAVRAALPENLRQIAQTAENATGDDMLGLIWRAIPPSPPRG